ncbi:hypothetical protein SUGI_0267590 [Cryptomeria japonica]|uniref:glyoxylase I 4 n=1 Tax=Cryptomeria japonica TaxID=3369 RepID=UPI002408EFAA|nr:glyoxylase I 4 [Cryptomeria japonica]XP_057838095.1 glyoxylase I 4 [Cryptomeria japonica]GLJ16073.1 hypothetical protein SUGI_0267590 [Cryptomeria japonica]
MEFQKDEYHPLPLLSLNHISLVCKSLPLSLQFYEKVMGFECVQRPVPNFKDAWLYNYGFGIHLLQSEGWDTDLFEKHEINPKDNHISFQCSDINLIEKRLRDMGIDYVKQVVEEEGLCIDQLFFHDPDGYMMGICNCENFPIVPSDEASAVPQLCPLKSADLTKTIFPLFCHGEDIEASERNGQFSEQAQEKKEMLPLDIMGVFI